MIADDDPTTADLAATGAQRGETPIAVDEQDRVDDKGGAISGEGAREAGAPGNEPLLRPEQIELFSGRWQQIQTGFVDQPQRAVEQADALVADLMQQLAAEFADARRDLETQWSHGESVSTEDLRVAITRYRSFVGRLLTT